MKHLQEIRKLISDLKQQYSTLHHQRETLEQAWSESVKSGLPAIEKKMDTVLTALREAELEEHKLTWARR